MIMKFKIKKKKNISSKISALYFCCAKISEVEKLKLLKNYNYNYAINKICVCGFMYYNN